jgi:hypothetical protein
LQHLFTSSGFDSFLATLAQLNDQVLLVFAKFIPMKTLFTTAKAAFAKAFIIYRADTSAWIWSMKKFALVDHVYYVFIFY